MKRLSDKKLNDHDILLISEDEISNFSDLLRDGDYVWIVESVDA